MEGGKRKVLTTNLEGQLGFASNIMPKVSFLILTYNSENDINPFFNSLFEKLGNKIKNGVYELIIFDNASSDKTVFKIRNYFQDKEKRNISIIFSPKNLGYAKGINEMAKKAQGEILIIINPDSELLEEEFEKVIQEFEINKKLAIAGLPIVNLKSEKEKNAGKFFNPFSFFLYSIGLENITNLRFFSNKKNKVDYVSGGFIAFKNEIFEKLNGYDEDYFMYVEDMDICFRAHKMGYETWFLPFGLLKHKGQGSSSREFAIVNIYKGLKAFYKKHAGGLELWYIKSLLILKAFLIIIVGALLGKSDLANTYKKAVKVFI